MHSNQALFLELTNVIVLQGLNCSTTWRPEADTGRKRKLDDSDDLSNPMASLTLHAMKKTKRFIEFTEDCKPIDPFEFANNGLSDVESTFSDESSSSGSYIELTEDWRPKYPFQFASHGLSDVESATADKSSCSGDSSKVPNNNTESSIESSDWNILAYGFDEKKQKKEQNRKPTSPWTKKDLSEENKEIAARSSREIDFSNLPAAEQKWRTSPVKWKIVELLVRYYGCFKFLSEHWNAITWTAGQLQSTMENKTIKQIFNCFGI